MLVVTGNVWPYSQPLAIVRTVRQTLHSSANFLCHQCHVTIRHLNIHQQWQLLLQPLGHPGCRTSQEITEAVSSEETAE